MPSRRVFSPVRQTLIKQEKQIKDELAHEMSVTAQEVKAWLQIATKSWKKKPRFRVDITVTPGKLSYHVVPIGKNRKIFTWVDKGTGIYGKKKKSIIIVPKKAKALSFRIGYKAKTAPVARINVGPGKATGKRVFAQRVVVKGIKPRLFSKTALDELTPDMRRRIENAIRRGVRRTT